MVLSGDALYYITLFHCVLLVVHTIILVQRGGDPGGSSHNIVICSSIIYGKLSKQKNYYIIIYDSYIKRQR